MAFNKNQKIAFLIELSILSILAFLIGSFATTSPFYGDLNLIDEGQFASWAFSMIHGQHMFKDMYVVYGPLYVYPVYILFKLFTPSAFLVRMYLALGGVIGIISVNLFAFEIHLKKSSRVILNILLLLLPVLVLRQALGWLCIYLLILAVTRVKKSYAIPLGIVAALTLLVSPDIGIFTFIICLSYFLYKLLVLHEKSYFYLLKYFLFSYFIVLGVFALWAQFEGWLSAYSVNTITQLVAFSGMNVPNGEGLPDVFMLMPFKHAIASWIKYFFSQELLIYFNIYILIMLSSYWTIKIIFKRFSQNEEKLLPVWFYSIFLLYISIRTPDINHLFFTLSPLLVIFSFYLDKAFMAIRNNNKISIKIPYIFVVFIIVLFFLRLLYINNPQIKKILHDPQAIITQANSPPYVGDIHISENQTKQILDLQRFFNSYSSTNDKIFFFTDEPMYYLLLHRENATKYVLPFAAVTRSMRFDLVNDLKKNKPKYIIIDMNAFAIDGINNSVRLPEAVKFISKNYERRKIIDGFIILQLKNG